MSFSTLSIDLAYKRYADIGAALLDCDRQPEGERWTIRLLDVPLCGDPTVGALVEWMVAVVRDHDIRVVCVDGPLGWKWEGAAAPFCRVSERAVRTPGKTGLPPDGVKPANYLPFTRFSIALFEALTTTHGWPLAGQHGKPSAPRPSARVPVVTETFPTAAWRALGLTPLAGKGKCTTADVFAACTRLAARLPLTLPEPVTHDQLQAVVGGLAGAWLAADRASRVHFAGDAPFRLDGCWREGYIMVPA